MFRGHDPIGGMEEGYNSYSEEIKRIETELLTLNYNLANFQLMKEDMQAELDSPDRREEAKQEIKQELAAQNKQIIDLQSLIRQKQGRIASLLSQNVNADFALREKEKYDPREND